MLAFFSIKNRYGSDAFGGIALLYYYFSQHFSSIIPLFLKKRVRRFSIEFCAFAHYDHQLFF
jgi:hypothetical protein